MIYNYKILLTLSALFTPLLHGMQLLPEKQLLSQRITAQEYLNKIEHGLYGKTLAQKINLLASVEYNLYTHKKDPVSNNPVMDLYKILVGAITFAAKPGTSYTPEKIKELAISQINAKYQLLADYYNKGLIDISTVSRNTEEVANISGEGNK